MANVAKKINQLHKFFMKMTVEKAVEIGRLLTKQKDKVGHGNWEDWMEKNLEFSASSAKRYMRLYDLRDKLISTSMTDLSLSEIYEMMDSRTEEEQEARKDSLREQDKDRNRRRADFANRKHNYINPPKGQYENQIIRGDCLKVMQTMIEDGMKDTYEEVTCSPPYNNGRDYGNGYDDAMPYDKYLAMLKQFILLSYQLLKKGGRLIINIGDMTRNQEKGDHHFMLESDIIQMIRTMGIELYEYERIVWYKGNSGSAWKTCWGSFCSPSSPKLRSRFETILIFSKQVHKLEKPDNIKPDISEKEFLEWTVNVWDLSPNTNQTIHPATYPEKLTERLIKLYSFPQGRILDCFSGSGTTCKSAQLLGRKFTGIDQNPNFAQYSRDRLDLTPQELREKYSKWMGGRKSKGKVTKTPKLVVSKLNQNISFIRKSA